MIKVIYGSKGTGKTKQIIDAANAAVATAKGHLIFITDNKRCMYDLEREKQTAATAAERRSQVGSGDRSERIRTYNFPQNRVTDHRLTGDGKNFNLAPILDGNLDPLIDALVTADQAARLQSGAGEEE